MLFIFILCYLWFILAGLAWIASNQELSTLGAVLLVGLVVALPGGALSGLSLWVTVNRVLPSWLTTLLAWALAALAYALLAWWTGEPKTIETMLVRQAAAVVVIWPIALAGVIKGVLIEGVLLTALMLAVYSKETAIRIAGSHLTVKLRVLLEIARSLGL